MAFVSVIIPSYNRKSVLERAINSVLSQTFTDYELIVVDDGSDDGTCDLEIIKSEKVKFYRFQVNCGVSRARNFGVSNSAGKWVAFLDSDDEWMPQKLEKQLWWIKNNPEYRIVQTNETWIRNGKKVNQ
ncbi:MAG: glycosyltransferase family 2 protein, partial [Fibrobacter sp.]|nr:glycosyltransferase family 2 protein [Fibrobacter sp.]